MHNKLNRPIFTALVTPLDAHGEIDFESLEALAWSQAQADNALLILGSTGEGSTLSREEMQAVATFITNLHLPVPIIVGVAGCHLKKVVEWMEFCLTLPFAGFMLTQPYYVRPGPLGQRSWYLALLDIARRPCAIYNHPGRTGSSVDPLILAELSRHPNLWALKDCSGTVEGFLSYRQAVPSLPIYTGNDELLPLLVPHGCRGAISVISNAWPDEARIFVHDCVSGKAVDADSWKEASVLAGILNPLSIKQLLFLQGKIKTPAARPPLYDGDVQHIQALKELVEQGFL